jgi:anti-anti-sigma regulatory factor
MPIQRHNEVSDEIYHRIYRLIKRRINAHTIAATLHLPVRTVLSVINRLEKKDTATQLPQATSEQNNESPDNNEYLDIYFYPKTRYAILDLVGALSERYIDQLKIEVDKVIQSSWKAVAIRMNDVYLLVEPAASQLLSAYEKYTTLGRYLALLDPSPSIEQDLLKYNLEPTIPIFGTERAFEEAAFAKKGKMFGRRSNQTSFET